MQELCMLDDVHSAEKTIFYAETAEILFALKLNLKIVRIFKAATGVACQGLGEQQRQSFRLGKKFKWTK